VPSQVKGGQSDKDHPVR